MKTILITGGSGLVGNHLAELLKDRYELRFLSRNPKKSNEYYWSIENGIIDEKAFVGVEAIIHLAGTSIADGRWSPHHKKQILETRVCSAKLLLEYVRKLRIPIETYISASAVGYYGTFTSPRIFTEDMSAGKDFLAEVCRQWEASADAFSSVVQRVVKLRLGMVVSKKGGALPKILFPAKYYLNSVLGNGNQWISWIDLEDLCQMIAYILGNPKMEGVYNAVAPNPITNRDFTYTLAKVLRKKVLLPPLPKWIVKQIFGKPAVLLLEGSRISANKIMQEGFSFQYDTLEKSLEKELER